MAQVELVSREASLITPRNITHIAYVVPDLEAGIRQWVELYGAGPFFTVGRVEFDEVDHAGGSAVWDHATAFGQCGPVAVELIQVQAIEPESLRSVFDRGSGIHHVSYFAEDPAEESRRLDELGFPRVVRGRTGAVEVTLHHAPGHEHFIEIHRRSQFMLEFFDMIAAAADGWDGKDPIRDIPGLEDGRPPA